MTLFFLSTAFLICASSTNATAAAAAAFLLQPTTKRISSSSSSKRDNNTIQLFAQQKEQNSKQKQQQQQQHIWSPQDLTKDIEGYLPIPKNDYIKKYQENPSYWPVEFFLIVYRRRRHHRCCTSQKTTKTTTTTEILVRKSANGTSKWGLGTGVPATRWLLSTSTPPNGYQWSTTAAAADHDNDDDDPHNHITFDASNFPEFPQGGKEQKTWTYRKIDICENAFHHPKKNAEYLQDLEMEEFAKTIRNHLQTKLAEMANSNNNNNNNKSSSLSLSLWESSRISIVKQIMENPNSVAAIQGTLRMSGIFAHKSSSSSAASENSRFISLNNNKNNKNKIIKQLIQSMQIHTMFPQMPNPLPHPSTSPSTLQDELQNRSINFANQNLNEHYDVHGRVYTHKSTSNVSNTIHGVYLTLDATDLLLLPEEEDEEEEEVPPAFDLFGTNRIKREWKSLEDLKVLKKKKEEEEEEDCDDILQDGKKKGKKLISTEDTKPTFISGFIVRQLVQDGIIRIDT